MDRINYEMKNFNILHEKYKLMIIDINARKEHSTIHNLKMENS